MADRSCGRGRGEELTISYVSVRPAVVYVAVAAGLVVATAILRGQAISYWDFLNPDEAELMARRARQSFLPSRSAPGQPESARTGYSSSPGWARSARR
jgi:hypothetical protein